MDSLKDEQPALRAVHGAKLDDVLKFLRGGLDDQPHRALDRSNEFDRLGFCKGPKRCCQEDRYRGR